MRKVLTVFLLLVSLFVMTTAVAYADSKPMLTSVNFGRGVR